MTTYTEAQIQARHQERVSALVDLFGSTMQIPNEIIRKLQERNKEDWVQFIAERDGKAKSEANAPLIPPATDEQMAAVDAEPAAEPAAELVAEPDETAEVASEEGYACTYGCGVEAATADEMNAHYDKLHSGEDTP